MYVSVNRRHVWKSWMEELSELLLLTGDSDSNWQCQSQPSVFHSNSLCECAPWPFPTSVHQPADCDTSPGVVQHQQHRVHSHGNWPGPEGNHRVRNDRHVPSSELLWHQSHLWKSVPEEWSLIWQSTDLILCSEYQTIPVQKSLKPHTTDTVYSYSFLSLFIHSTCSSRPVLELMTQSIPTTKLRLIWPSRWQGTSLDQSSAGQDTRSPYPRLSLWAMKFWL